MRKPYWARWSLARLCRTSHCCHMTAGRRSLAWPGWRLIPSSEVGHITLLVPGCPPVIVHQGELTGCCKLHRETSVS